MGTLSPAARQTARKGPVPRPADQADGLRGGQDHVLADGGGHSQAVDEDSVLRHPRRLGGLGHPESGVPAAVRVVGDAAAVQSQDHQPRAILGGQGQHGGHALRFPIDGVQDGPAPADPESPLEGGGVGAVDDQGQGRHPLDSQDQIGQSLPLVDVREPGVDHQEVRPLLLLLEGQLPGVVPGLIRSPTAATESRAMARLPCQPQKRLTASSAWRCRGFRPRSRGANARMWPGVVPQQPPRMAAPMSRNVLPHRANSSGPTSKTVSPPSRRGRPALGWIMTGRSVTASMASRAPSS